MSFWTNYHTEKKIKTKKKKEKIVETNIEQGLFFFRTTSVSLGVLRSWVSIEVRRLYTLVGDQTNYIMWNCKLKSPSINHRL